MPKRLPFAIGRVLMAWMVALSLLLAGFGHVPVPRAGQGDQALQLADLGLTADDLCGADHGQGGAMHGGDCAFCRLAASCLPGRTAVWVADIPLRSTAIVLAPAERRGVGHIANPATPVRAPPVA